MLDNQIKYRVYVVNYIQSICEIIYLILGYENLVFIDYVICYRIGVVI